MKYSDDYKYIKEHDEDYVPSDRSLKRKEKRIVKKYSKKVNVTKHKHFWSALSYREKVLIIDDYQYDINLGITSATFVSWLPKTFDRFENKVKRGIRNSKIKDIIGE